MACIESAKTNVASGFYVCLMCELLFCAAVLAVSGVFGDLLSAQLWQNIVSSSCSGVGAVASLTVRKTFWMFSLLASIIYPLTLGAIFDMPGTTKPKKVKKKVATALIAPMTVKAIAAPNGRRAAASFYLNGPMVTSELMPSARKTTAKTRVKHHTMRKVLTTRERFFCVFDTF